MQLGLSDKAVLITGASRGIGAGLAEAFASEGCQRLHLVARSAKGLSETRDRIAAFSAAAVSVQAIDLTEEGAVAKVFREAGDIDILVNNAGAIPGGALDEVDEAAWRRGWELKVMGYVAMTRMAYAAMRKRGAGVIINNIGNGGEVFDPNYIAGTTGNAALMTFTRTMGAFSLDEGIRVVGVNPGPVDTDRIRALLRRRAAASLGSAERHAELAGRYPMGRPAHIAEIADLILFLASERARYISGVVMTIDGGLSSRRAPF